MTDEENPSPPQEADLSAAAPDASVAPEISRRVGSILDAVESEAKGLREEAREEARRYLEQAQRQADDLVEERRRRIAALSDELVAKSEAVVARLDDAEPVWRGFENLVRALGQAAERLSRETELGRDDLQPPPFLGAELDVTDPAWQFEVVQPPAAPGWSQRPDPARSGIHHPSPYAPPDEPQPQPPPWAFDPASGSPDQPPPAGAPAAPVRDDRGAGQPPPASRGAASWRELDDARRVAVQMAASGATRGDVEAHLHETVGSGEALAVLDEVFGPAGGEDAPGPWTAPRP